MSATDTAPAPAARPPGAARLPSLNQLAARINTLNTSTGSDGAASNTTNNASSGSDKAGPTGGAGARPRLAASVLRTGSNVSLATTASTADSTAVNPPATRSTSPNTISTPPPAIVDEPVPIVSGFGSAETEEGEPLTQKKLEELNKESGTGTERQRTSSSAPKYKNIPTLDAITARLAKARQLSVDGSAKPPEPEMIEDPKTPGLQIKAPEHPLQFSWTIYHDTKSKFPFTPAPTTAPNPPGTAQSDTFTHVPESGVDYEAGLTVVGEFTTVETFCRYFNWLKPPSKLEKNSNYHLFKTGIKPMWEDPANASGGKWVLTMKNNPNLLDRCWSWVCMALVGEELEEGRDEVCGCVVSLRSKVDRIQVWTRGKEDVERLNAIGKKIVKLLDVSEADGIGLEFQYNTDDRPLPNKFLSISAMPATSYRTSFVGPPGTPKGGAPGVGDQSAPNSANPQGPGAGAFGSFGIGIGAGTPGGRKVQPGGAGWR